MATYTLNVTNNSFTEQTFVIYQKYPSIGSEMYSTAWRTVQIPNGGKSTVTWDDSLSVFQSQSRLMQGSVIDVSSQVNVEISGENTAKIEGSGPPYSLSAERSPFPTNDITVQSGMIQQDCVVGISLDGSPVCATSIFPNTTMEFTPPSTYFIGAGNVSKGEIIDPEQLQTTQVDFSNSTSLNATFEPTSTWSISQIGFN